MNVKKSKIALLLAAGAVSMALTGCGGDDGTDGNPGNPGGPAADYINTLNLKVTDVTYTDGQPTIKVFATNEEDLPVIGLQDLGVVAAQLTPQGATGAGNSAQWTRTARASGVDSYTDNKDGSYSFTLELSEYSADMTQRFNVYAGGKGSTLADGATTVPRREIVADFDGQGYEAKYTKDIVSHETCTNCHAEGEPLTTRHSSYYTQETCATCHSSSMSTESQWNHLIHNIHNTAKTFEDKYDKEYTGAAAEALIQNNCKSCHVEPEADSGELAEWGNWSRIPTMETCTSCHTNIDFEAGKGHSQQADNSNCIACHNSSWTEELHTSSFGDTKALIDTYGINVTSSIDSTTAAATISIQVVDSAGAEVDINTILPMVQRLEVITNVGPNNVTLGYGGKDSINAIKNGVVDAKAAIEDGKLVYTTTQDLELGAVGADDETAFTFVGWAMCSADGEFVKCDDADFDGKDTDKYTGMKADLAFATLSGEAPSMRHVDSVNFTACATCHSAEFQVHKGGNHAGFVMSEQLAHTKDANDQPIIGVDACAACHTADGTPYSPVGALELKLHARHNSEGIIKDCTQCHNDFNLDAFKVKGAIASSFAGTDVYTTPIAATCASCHSYNMDKFKSHVEGQGALVNVSKDEATDAAQLETCFYCHAPTPADHTAVKM
ncbi:OmcA/MtrC family decaheme c-type cytochrome [Shewanella sp. 10N.286.54.B9]|uniref:OmcA/MtrC family decaheme c-type cytochrome n=2 Tax=Gammaproteobacteria TaxID=1236 RepID=UPI00355158EC